MKWFLGILSLSLGTTSWVLYTRLQAAEHKAASLSSENSKLTIRLKRDEARDLAELKVEEDSLSRLRGERAAEQAEIDRITGDLGARENLGIDKGYRSHLEEEKAKHRALIAGYEQELAEARGQAGQLSTGGKQAHGASLDNVRAQQAQENDAIHALEAKIAADKAVIADAKKRPYDFNAQQASRALIPQVAEEQSQLDQLKAQRRENDAVWKAQLSAADGENRVAVGQAQDSVKAIQAKIQTEKDAIKGFDQALGKESGSEKERRALLDGLRASLKDHQSKARDLDARILSENSKVQALQAP